MKYLIDMADKNVEIELRICESIEQKIKTLSTKRKR